MADHTPGPWRSVDSSVHPTDDDDGARFFDIRAGEEVRSSYAPMLKGYIDCGGQQVASVMKSLKTGEANARLIAAAPCLLEALEKAQNTLAGCGMAKIADDICAGPIAKARGHDRGTA